MAKKEVVNEDTGEVGTLKLNKVVITTVRRPNGSLRIQHGYENCPTMAEQHTAHLSDINYLMKKFKPDELASFIAARNAHRREILGHDFSREADLQGAKNITYRLTEAYKKLPNEIRNQFRSPVDFYKYVDNPANQEKLIKLGIFTKQQIKDVTAPLNDDKPNDDKKAPTSDKIQQPAK